jgi:5'(3')-deoxyribonucleotidase
MSKKTIFVDMDGVLVDFESGIQNLSDEDRAKYKGRYDAAPGIFDLMNPMPGAIESFAWLSENFDAYILSTAPWRNPGAWQSKRLWAEKYLMPYAKKRLILSHNKHLCKGDFLIDDRTANGAGDFDGELIQFGKGSFSTWPDVVNYLKTQLSN